VFDLVHHHDLDQNHLVDMVPALVAITREDLDRISIDAWMALNEYPSNWDPLTDVIEWQIPPAIWTFLILKYPEVVAKTQQNRN
jgi:hypothetical protein